MKECRNESECPTPLECAAAGKCRRATEELKSVDQRRLVLPAPPLRVRLWACLHNLRAWRTRRKMDKAVCAMIRDGINTPLAYELMIESCKQWDAAFEKYRQNAGSDAPGASE